MKRNFKIGEEVSLKVRVSEKDVHYAGGLVNGGWVISMFGDVGTELAARYDGDEGLLRGYSSIDLLKPIHAGDFIEITGKIVKVGNTSRIQEFVAKRYIKPAPQPNQESAVDVLDESEIVAKATMIGVTPKEWQRFTD